jgi:hypothetical protein
MQLRMITARNERGSYLKVGEVEPGKFTILAQYGPMNISSFDFNHPTPRVTAALRELQMAMAEANLDGAGGGTNSAFQWP